MGLRRLLSKANRNKVVWFLNGFYSWRKTIIQSLIAGAMSYLICLFLFLANSGHINDMLARRIELSLHMKTLMFFEPFRWEGIVVALLAGFFSVMFVKWTNRD